MLWCILEKFPVKPAVVLVVTAVFGLWATLTAFIHSDFMSTCYRDVRGEEGRITAVPGTAVGGTGTTQPGTSTIPPSTFTSIDTDIHADSDTATGIVTLAAPSDDASPDGISMRQHAASLPIIVKTRYQEVLTTLEVLYHSIPNWLWYLGVYPFMVVIPMCVYSRLQVSTSRFF